MKALTLWQPWAWAICWAKKRIENREWSPLHYGLHVGDYFAVHAAVKKPSPEDWAAVRDAAGAFMSERSVEGLPWEEVPLGAVVAVVQLLDVVSDVRGPRLAGQHIWRSDSRFAWCLGEPVVLPSPVPCRGRQKLWTLPDDVEAEVLHQMGKARL